MITIYTHAMRDAALDDPVITAEDVVIYDDSIDAYIEYVRDRLRAANMDLDIADSVGGRSYIADTADEEREMQQVPDFWSWYQGLR